MHLIQICIEYVNMHACYMSFGVCLFNTAVYLIWASACLYLSFMNHTSFSKLKQLWNLRCMPFTQNNTLVFLS